MPIERHFLYGEPAREVEPRFLHVEPIRLRSGRHDWIIAPHAHAALHQILFVTAGGGAMRVESDQFRIEPPALLFVPAGAIHAFDFTETTDGFVITVADAMVSEVARGDTLVALLRQRGSCSNALEARSADTLFGAFSALSQEFVWSAPGRMLAITAELMRILVTAGRILGTRDQNPDETSTDAPLIERFRRLIEQDFRRSASIASYAQKLAVTEDRLLATCQRRFQEPPLKLVHRRIMLEAQRWLLYTSMSIGDISEELGFRDPAYFSRFFSHRAGCTPRAFRQSQGKSINRCETAPEVQA
jgi:AraC family transcriptional activator of pobA